MIVQTLTKVKERLGKASNQFAAPEKIWRGEVGQLGGFKIISSNAPAFGATLQSGAGQASRVYSSFPIARQAYMITDLQSIQVYNTPPGGQSDALYQNRKLGWKFSFKSVIEKYSHFIEKSMFTNLTISEKLV